MGARANIGARWFGPGERLPPRLYRSPEKPTAIDWWRPIEVPVIISNADETKVVLPYWYCPAPDREGSPA